MIVTAVLSLLPAVGFAQNLPDLESVKTYYAHDVDASLEVSQQRKILISWSKKDHPPKCHDYQGFAKDYAAMLSKVKNITATEVEGFPTKSQFTASDLIIFYLTNKVFTLEQQTLVDEYLADGKSMIVLHQALVPDQGARAWADRIGLAYSKAKKDGCRWGSGTLKTTLDTSHPIFKGFPAKLIFREELYWNLIHANPHGLNIIGRASAPNEKEVKWPLFWTVEDPTKGRVFCSVIGHFNEFNSSPFFRLIILRATAWSLSEPFAPFSALISE